MQGSLGNRLIMMLASRLAEVGWLAAQTFTQDIAKLPCRAA